MTPNAYRLRRRGTTRQSYRDPCRVILHTIDADTSALTIIPEDGQRPPGLYFTAEGIANLKRQVDRAHEAHERLKRRGTA